MLPHRWPKGKSGNPLGRPRKKPIADVLLMLLDKPAPKEFYVNGFEALKAGSMSLGEMVAARMVYSAACGAKNPGLASAVEIMNRVIGKVPLPVVSREVEHDEFVGLTEEELDQRLAVLARRVKLLTDGEDGKK